MPCFINILEVEAGCQDDGTFMNIDGIQPIEVSSLRPQNIDPGKGRESLEFKEPML